MEILAPLISALIWIFCYLISLYSFSYIFSDRIVYRGLTGKMNRNLIIYFLLGAIFISPIIVGLLFRLGGILGKGNNIPWGARIENFTDISFFLWILSFLCFFILLLVAFIKPQLYGFGKRYKALLFYVMHHLYTYILIVLIKHLIPLISGPLSRMNSTSGGFGF